MMNLVNTLNLKQNMIANDTYTATSDMFNFDALFTYLSENAQLFNC